MNLRKLNKKIEDDIFNKNRASTLVEDIKVRGSNLVIRPIQQRMLDFTEENDRACIISGRQTGKTMFSFMRLLLSTAENILILSPTQTTVECTLDSLSQFLSIHTNHNVIESRHNITTYLDNNRVKSIDINTPNRFETRVDTLYSYDLIIIDNIDNMKQLNLPLYHKDNIILLGTDIDKIELDVNMVGIFDTMIVSDD